jgi:hypothetical protein
MEGASESAKKLIFMDTSAFKAYYDKRDKHYRDARSFVSGVVSGKNEFRLFVTSDYIIDETATLVKVACGAEEASRFLDAVQRSRIIIVTHVEEEYFKKAKEMFEKYTDKKWSFTDCTSFTIMKELGINNAFSFDEDFEQAGFKIHPLMEK